MKLRGWLLAGAGLGSAMLLVGAHAKPSGQAQTSAVHSERPTAPGETYRSPVPAAQRRVYFGELHLHTALSLDAWSSGTKLTPDDAFRFGRGQTVMVPGSQMARHVGLDASHDVPVRRAWPLDFMAVTDHSESLGLLHDLDDPASAFSRSSLGRQIAAAPRLAARLLRQATGDRTSEPASSAPDAFSRAWASVITAANANYQPGKFTTFIAYEWSSAPKGANLHRNVIFNSDHAPAPFSADDSDKPEDLWTYLERNRANGIDVLAFPHNANASNGLMFDWNMSDGRPIDEAYAQRRALNEPGTEIAQIKGQSETLPVLSPNDEFADFEVFDTLLSGQAKSAPHGSYVREAYGRGLVIQSKVGANPFKYGMIGGSDIHNGLSNSDENSFIGGQLGGDGKQMTPVGAKLARTLAEAKPVANPADEVEAGGEVYATGVDAVIERSSPGLTGVWAEENTRNAIFAALKRKETFGNSGVRIRVRIFGGWGFDPTMLKAKDWVARAYATGAPMGSDLPARPAAACAPGFIIQAMKDPTEANLDRAQVIKVSLDGAGGYTEKIFDVALSDGRKVDPRTGKAPPIANTVDVKTGKVARGVGAPSFTVFWRDPEFDPARAAVYYVRVLQAPTPRWSTLLAIRTHMPLPTARPLTIQERAWSSPIWYTPGKASGGCPARPARR